VAKLAEDLRWQQRRQYRPRAPKKVGDVLANLLARRGYARIQAAALLQGTWDKLIGERLAGKTRVGRLQRGVMEVTVQSSAVMQELTFQKTRLLKSIKETMPEEKIRDLKFRVGPIG